jgi:hypothetical protein
VNTHDPADSIVYVPMAMDGARTHARLADGDSEVSTSTTGAAMANDHDQPSPERGHVVGLAVLGPQLPLTI